MGDYKAVAALNASLRKTAEILFTKFNPYFWLKLALVLLIANFTLGGSGFGQNLSSPHEDLNFNITTEVLIVVIFVALFLIALSLTFQYLSSVFKFMFIESLSKEDVRFIAWFRGNMERGLALFLFTIAIDLVLILSMVILAVLFFGIVFYFENAAVTILLATLFFTAIFALAILSSLISSFTTDFAMPLMLGRRLGILEAWSRIIQLVRENPGEFIVYLLLKIILTLITSVISGVIGIVVILVVIVIAAIAVFGVAAILLLAVGAFPALSPILLVAIFFGIILLMLLMIFTGYVTIVLTLPIPVFLRLYSIYFIQYFDPDVRLVSEESEKPKPPAARKRRTANREKMISDLEVY
ncbi:MAG TPA: hypothetical protein ENN13_02800 [Candidatus Altiarchaeales archaeon]|nr:hypothetical protein [Candidatus Altiarchaeales archaeon]